MKKKYFIIAAVTVFGSSLLLGNMVTKHKGAGLLDQETKAHVSLLLENKAQYIAALNDCQKSTKVATVKKCKAVKIATKEYNNKMTAYVDKPMRSYILQ